MAVDCCLRYQSSINSLSIGLLLPEPNFAWHSVPRANTAYTLTLSNTGALLLLSHSEAREGLAYVEARAAGAQKFNCQPALELKEMTLLRLLFPFLASRSPISSFDHRDSLLTLRFSLKDSARGLVTSMVEKEGAMPASVQSLYCRSCGMTCVVGAKDVIMAPGLQSSATTLESYTCHPSFESKPSLCLAQLLAQALKRHENRMFYNQQYFYLSNNDPEHDHAVQCKACHETLGHTEQTFLSMLSRYKVSVDTEKDSVVRVLANELLELVQYHAQYHFILQGQLKIWIVSTESFIQSSKESCLQRVMLVYYQNHEDASYLSDPACHWAGVALADSSAALKQVLRSLERSTAALLDLSRPWSSNKHHDDRFQLGYLLL